MLRRHIRGIGKREFFRRLLLRFSSDPTQQYETALREYRLYTAGRDDTDGTHVCICSQCELKELFYVENKKTRAVLLIGSTCIHKFGWNLRELIPNNELFE